MSGETTETLTAEQQFACALADFQQELPSVRKENTATVRSDKGNYSYAYADLTDISEAALPLLAKHGLSFTAAPTVTDHGFVLRYALLHTAGHREGGDFPLPDASKYGAQQIGSWLTYSRRYALCAVTGIAPGGDDDDAEKAKDARAADPLPRAPRTRGATTRQTAEQLGDPVTRPDEFAAPVTDGEWLAGIRTRLEACGSVAEVRGLWTETAAVHHAGKLTDEDRAEFEAAMTARMAELKPQAVAG